MALAALLALESFLERKAIGRADGPDRGTHQGPKPFRPEWLENFRRGDPGCLHPPLDTYSWRTAGWGSNVNTLLLQWAEALVSGRTDVAIIFDSDWPWFEQTTCEEASGRVEITGWHCIFQRMPHLCTYNDLEEWKGALTPLSVSSVERGQAQGRIGDAYARRNRPVLRRGLKGTGLNEKKALAMLLDHVYSHFQKWFENDIAAILNEPSIATLRQGKYMGVHVRRTDKLLYEAIKTETEEYFKAAAKYLHDAARQGQAATDISGVWLSSDDRSVLAEVQEIAPRYFPKVDIEKILFISDRVPLENNSSLDPEALLKGAQSRNGYYAVVLLMAELRMLAGADVFSGTFSSNVGRMVTLMRNETSTIASSRTSRRKQRPPTLLPLCRDVTREAGEEMWKPNQVVEDSRRRAILVWTVSVLAIVAYSGWLVYKAVEKAETPDTSFVLTNEVYKYPDLWVCPYVRYGCDTWELERSCVDSAWMTEAGPPDAVFYPRLKLDNPWEHTIDERRIEAFPEDTGVDSEGNQKNGRGNCVVFKTSAATDFLGQQRDPEEYLDYILLDMYWYPGGVNGTSETCVPEGVHWKDHREWMYAFLSDPDDPNQISTGVQLTYSCITNTSNTHIFNTIELGLTNQNKYAADDISSYKALFTNFGVHKNVVNTTIKMPYARLSLELKQQADSWEIITEANPFEFAEMFGNIGGFWDLLLILWPLCFVAATQQEPTLKPRTFRKSIIRGAERAAGVKKVVARVAPIRRNSSAASAVDSFAGAQELPYWEHKQPSPRQSEPPRVPFWQESNRC
eukprot:g12221.t1